LCLFQNGHKLKEESIWWTNQLPLSCLLYVGTKALSMACYCFRWRKGCSFFITSVISPMYLLPMSHNINNPSYFSYKHKTTSIDQFATTNLVNMHSFVTLNWWQHRTPRLPILERECTLRGATLAHSFLKISNFVVPHFYQFANLAW